VAAVLQSFPASKSPYDGWLPLSLHDALPIFHRVVERAGNRADDAEAEPFVELHRRGVRLHDRVELHTRESLLAGPVECVPHHGRSEEHTSELQSRENLVCRLLLEKKKTVERA